ncbi:UNVERIFIED_CONTAM: hypothetical protein RMT77_005516 [Armadillidium vulgare]
MRFFLLFFIGITVIFLVDASSSFAPDQECPFKDCKFLDYNNCVQCLTDGLRHYVGKFLAKKGRKFIEQICKHLSNAC